jgi:hypothetical protein
MYISGDIRRFQIKLTRCRREYKEDTRDNTLKVYDKLWNITNTDVSHEISLKLPLICTDF